MEFGLQSSRTYNTREGITEMQMTDTQKKELIKQAMLAASFLLFYRGKQEKFYCVPAFGIVSCRGINPVTLFRELESSGYIQIQKKSLFEPGDVWVTFSLTSNGKLEGYRVQKQFPHLDQITKELCEKGSHNTKWDQGIQAKSAEWN